MIQIRLIKYWLVLEPEELMQMLKAFPAIWEKGIRRGKLTSRAEKEQHRHGK
jgi:hypothetical protein